MIRECVNWIFVLCMFVLLIYKSCLVQSITPKTSSFGFRGLAKSFFSLFHSAQYKKVNVSISELDIFPNEYSGWNENLKGHTFCSTR